MQSTTQTQQLYVGPQAVGQVSLLSLGNERRLAAVNAVCTSLASATGVPSDPNPMSRLSHVHRISRLLIQRDNGVMVKGSDIMTRAIQAMKKLLRNQGVGLAVVKGCLNSNDNITVWNSIRPFEAARLAQLALTTTIDGATGERAESDEHHLYKVGGDGRLSSSGSAYNVIYNLPHNAGVVIALIQKLSADTFTNMDNYAKERVALDADSTQRGGLNDPEGVYARLFRIKPVIGVNVQVIMINACAQIMECEGIGTLSFSETIAFIQCYIYVVSLGVRPERVKPVMVDGKVKRSRDLTYLGSFVKKAKEVIKGQVAAMVTESGLVNEVGVDTYVNNYMNKFKPEYPAIWMYVYVCLCIQRVTGTIPPPEAEVESLYSLCAVKDAYIPCVKKDKSGKWKSLNYLHEALGSCNSYVPIINQILSFDWFECQLQAIAGEAAIINSTDISREDVPDMEVVLHIGIHDDDDLNELETYLDESTHFKSRLESNDIRSFAVGLLKAYFTSPYLSAAAGGGVYRDKISETFSVVTVHRNGSFLDKNFDCLEDGTVSLSNMMFSGGLSGVTNVRIVLKTRVSPQFFNLVQSESIDNVNMQLNALFASEKGTPNAMLLPEDGFITLILAYNTAVLTYNTEKSKWMLYVDGGERKDISDLTRARVSRMKYRSYNNGVPGQLTTNPYDKGDGRARGVTASSNVTHDSDSILAKQLIMTVPAGNLRNLYKLWLAKGTKGVTFEEFVSTDEHSVRFLTTLPKDVRERFKKVLPITNEHTGLMEVFNVFSDEGIFAMPDSGEGVPITMKDEIDVANGKPFTYEKMGLELGAKGFGKRIRQEVAAVTTGISMQLAELFIEQLDNDATQQSGDYSLKEDLINLCYYLWSQSAIYGGSKTSPGLHDLIGKKVGDMIFTRNYLKMLYKVQFMRVVARQGYERHVYDYSSHDAIVVRLVLGTFMTLQMAKVSTKSGLQVEDIEGLERREDGPLPEFALLEPSRRNMRAVIARESQIPSTIKGVGGLTVFLATPLDIASLMSMSGDSSLRELFSDVQRLNGVYIESSVQRNYTYMNAITHYRKVHVSGKPSMLQRHPYEGEEIGYIKNPGFGAGGLEMVQCSGDDSWLQCGLAEDVFIKINEAGQIVGGIDNLARQMLSLQTAYELANPRSRGQIFMVNTGMVYIFTALVWTYPSSTYTEGKSDAAQILGKRVFVDPRIRFSSRMLRGKKSLHNLRMHGLSLEVADKRASKGSMVTPTSANILR